MRPLVCVSALFFCCLTCSPHPQELIHRPELLDQYLSISASATILAYSLYSVSESTVARYGPHGLLWTVPFVVYGILRYLHLLHEEGKGESAANDLLDDRHLLVTVIAWGAAVLWIVLT